MKVDDKVYCIKSFKCDIELFTINNSYLIHTIRDNKVFLCTNYGKEDYYGFSYIKKYSDWEFFNDYFMTEKQYLRKQKLLKLYQTR